MKNPELKWWRRWGFMGAQDIGDDPYLDRLRIVWTPLFSLYLHHIHRDDGGRAPHDHPWWFCSFVLTGSYAERYYPNKHRAIGWEQRHKRWSLHSFSTKAAHKIIDVEKPLWTLVITGPPVNTQWGFWRAVAKKGTLRHTSIVHEFIPWQDYLGRENIAAGWPTWKQKGKLK